MGNVAPEVPKYIRIRNRNTGEWKVDPDLKPRLAADADAEGTNMNEVAIRVLSARFGVPFAPSGRRASPASMSDYELYLTLPGDLYQRIRRSVANDRQANKAILQALHAHYGLSMPARARRGRRSVTPAAV